MRICEIFSSIQGEGRYAGYPCLFVRVSSCTRNCDFCDTKFHKDGKEMSVEEVINIIKRSDKEIVVWTGGEPVLQMDDISKIILRTRNKLHHLESNGDLKIPYLFFDYVCISPKDLKAIRTNHLKKKLMSVDVKVVTDLKLNADLIPYATMLMPLTVDYNGPIDKQIEQKVWDYCVKYNIRFCLRQHVHVWGQRQKK